MKQRTDFKQRPRFYDKPKQKMDKSDNCIYWAIAIGLFGLMCLIFLNLDMRFK